MNDFNFNNDFWGKHELNVNESGHWEIGPMQLWIARYQNEWRIYSRHTGDMHSRLVKVQIPCPTADIPNDHNYIKRFCLKNTGPAFSFVPALANLPIVIRPEDAFYLPPKEETHLYINSTLWLRIMIGENAILDEFPVYRLTDTWFGPSEREGEFCYAAKISAKLNFNDLNLSPYRSITKIYIKNMADDSLFLEKLKIPIPNLSLYKNDQGLFFTESIILQRSRSGDQVRLSLGHPPKHEAGEGLQKIGGPREELENHFVAKTIHSLFGREDYVWKHG